MKDFHIQIAINALTIFAIVWGVYLFWVKRERFTFLNLSLHSTSICAILELTLVQLSVRLENKGGIRLIFNSRRN